MCEREAKWFREYIKAPDQEQIAYKTMREGGKEKLSYEQTEIEFKVLQRAIERKLKSKRIHGSADKKTPKSIAALPRAGGLPGLCKQQRCGSESMTFLPLHPDLGYRIRPIYL